MDDGLRLTGLTDQLEGVRDRPGQEGLRVVVGAREMTSI